MVPYCLDKVSFTMSGLPVDKEWIIGDSWSLTYSLGISVLSKMYYTPVMVKVGLKNGKKMMGVELDLYTIHLAEKSSAAKAGDAAAAAVAAESGA